MTAETVLKHLMYYAPGRRYAIPSAELEAELMVSGNELRRFINRLRRAGEPIGSCDEGYFFAATAGEIYATIRSLKKMQDGLEAAISGLEKSLYSFGVGGDCV